MNYLLRGPGSQIYGPMTGAELRHWLQEKRISIHTEVRQKGSEEWKPLRELPEFADLPQIQALTGQQKQYLIKVSGKQFGPLTESEIRRWLSEKRISLHAQAQQQGQTEWKQLRDMPDFSDMPELQSLINPSTQYLIQTAGQISGPLTGAEVRNWIKKRRITIHTYIKPKGSEEWKRIRDMPEFADVVPPP